MIKQYHTKTGNRIRLIHADCMEWMQDCDKYDLAIVDPPYGIGWDKDNLEKYNSTSCGAWKTRKPKGYKKGSWDSKRPSDKFFTLIKSVSENQIIWGGNYFTDYLEPTGGWIIWDKGVVMPTFSDGEMAWQSITNSMKIVEMLWAGYRKCEETDRMHPTQKPVKLYRWLLQNYAQCKYCRGLGSYKEDVAGDGGSRMRLTCEDCNGRGGANILDTHGGSMSHAIACWEEDFELDIIELDKDYYDSAVKRFEQHISQKTLF